MWRWEFCVGLGVWGLQERQLRGGGSCTQLGYPGLEALMEFCAVQHLWGGGKVLEEVVLIPQIFWSLSSAGYQTDLRHLHQPCHLAGPRSQAG